MRGAPTAVLRDARPMKPRGTVLLAVATLQAACAAHVQLPPAPPRDAPLPLRVATYRTYRPIESLTVQNVTVDRYGNRFTGPSELAYITLANAATVADPADLAPLIDARSVTALETERAASLRVPGSLLEALGVIGIIGGTVLAIRGVVDVTSDDPGGGSAAFLWAGGATVLGATAAYLVGSLGFMRPAAQRRARALRAFDDSLRGRLGLCDDGGARPNCTAVMAP